MLSNEMATSNTLLVTLGPKSKGAHTRIRKEDGFAVELSRGHQTICLIKEILNLIIRDLDPIKRSIVANISRANQVISVPGNHEDGSVVLFRLNINRDGRSSGKWTNYQMASLRAADQRRYAGQSAFIKELV